MIIKLGNFGKKITDSVQLYVSNNCTLSVILLHRITDLIIIASVAVCTFALYLVQFSSVQFSLFDPIQTVT